jgi:hypothetical protein
MWALSNAFASPRECEMARDKECERMKECKGIREKTEWEHQRLKKQERWWACEKENESEKKKDGNRESESEWAQP